MSLEKELFQKCLAAPYVTIGDDFQYFYDGERTIYFQCSSSDADWRKNLDFFPIPVKPYKGCTWYAHRGFVKVWKSVRDTILPIVKEIYSNGFVPRIVGYSHGAAIAALAHEDIIFNIELGKQEDIFINDVEQNHFYPETLVFGCPRVVWLSKSVAWRFDSIDNYQVIGDMVTHMPPKLFGYRDFGTKIKLGNWFPIWPWRHEPKNYLRYL
jgi:hypothetical protein